MHLNLKQASVLIVEDDDLACHSLAYLLKEQGIDKIMMACDGQKAFNLCLLEGSSRPDIILMDIGLPIMDGITATKKIKKIAPNIKVIMLTSHHATQEVQSALASGADGYCLKDISIERLCRVMEELLEGALWLDPAIVAPLQQWIAKSTQLDEDVSNIISNNFGLTERESKILVEVVNGKTNKEIAAHFGSSPHTIKTHVTNIIHKLDVSDRTQAAVKAIQCELI